MDSGQTPPLRPPSKLHLSPRRELQLQGPRPSPLRVSNDSHKIKKPPAPPLQPVIIYSVSPKIIHVESSRFMDLVQRLTGPRIVDPDTPPAASPSFPRRLLSPATIQSPGADRPMAFSAASLDVLDGLEMDGGPQLDQQASIPGILSPIPASLPPISPAFFSPHSVDSSSLDFLHDHSPGASQFGRPSPGGSTAGGGGGWSYLNSPGKFFSPYFIPSPGAAAWDLFNQFQDF